MNAEGGIAFRGGRRLARTSAVLAAVGALGLVAGALVDLDRFFLSYLAAYAYVVSVALGALLFLMTGNAMRAGWPTLFRRLTEIMVGTLPLLAVLFIPLLYGIGRLYPWTRLATIESAAERELVSRKLAYLNTPGFVARTVVYFAIWLGAAHLLRRWSRAQDRDLGEVARSRLHIISAVLLPVVALAFSFASFDWLMSLMPAWYSTMFPVYWFGGGFLGAIAALTLLAAAADRTGRIRGINPSHYYALGRLLLAFVIFWAYVAFFQFMLQWIADKPDEVTFYIARKSDGFLAESVLLVATKFVIPFFALLPYGIKRRRDRLAAMAAWILAAHYIDMHWLVMPSVRPRVPPFHWLDLAALLGLGGITVLFGLWRAQGRALVPYRDPALPRALRYDSV